MKTTMCASNLQSILTLSSHVLPDCQRRHPNDQAQFFRTTGLIATAIDRKQWFLAIGQREDLCDPPGGLKLERSDESP